MIAFGSDNFVRTCICISICICIFYVSIVFALLLGVGGVYLQSRKPTECSGRSQLTAWQPDFLPSVRSHVFVFVFVFVVVFFICICICICICIFKSLHIMLAYGGFKCTGALEQVGENILMGGEILYWDRPFLFIPSCA